MSNMHNDDNEMLDRISATLNQSAESIDPQTLRALKLARHESLAQLKKPIHNWWPVTGVAAFASVALLVFGLVVFQVDDNAMLDEVEDLSLLTAEDDLELYENLEFYQWLEFEERTG